MLRIISAVKYRDEQVKEEVSAEEIEEPVVYGEVKLSMDEIEVILMIVQFQFISK